MLCCIKEWPDKMATLMTEDGVVVWTFNSVEEARAVWHDWYQQQTHQSQQRSVTRTSLEMSELPIEIYAHSPSFSSWLKAITASCYRYLFANSGKLLD